MKKGERLPPTRDSLVLVVDDEPDIRELLELTLIKMGIGVCVAGSVVEAKKQLAETRFDLCLTDMRLPDGEGLELVRHIATLGFDLPVAVITAYGSAENAVAALKAGAFDYVSKPLGQLARTQAPVYLSGESGSGKELAARLIHGNGARRDKRFVPVNCGAIPENLMESEFFGYRKGAFTGADQDRDGFFQAANGGTLFLDEVADLPLAMQVKLLRAIQEKKVRKLGATQEDAVDVRIISATHQNLAELVETGRFRQDLFYRLNVIELKMPPLRECREDVAQISAAILARLSAQNGGAPARLAQAALDALLKYDFPGNIRELENILERATALSGSAEIGVEELGIQPLTAEQDAVDDSQREAAGLPSLPLPDYLDHVERQAITHALIRTGFNRTAAAKLLGVTFRALRYRMQRLSIREPDQ
jgi:two-component system response regulator PilR (NtrC family)